MSLTHRTAARLEDEMTEAESRKKPETWFAGCRTDGTADLLLGRGSRRHRTLRADHLGLRRRLFPLSRRFRRSGRRAGAEELHAQLGFEDEDALFPNDNRIFRGFDFLREYFMFPRKFLGFKLTGLATVMPKLKREIGRPSVHVQRGDGAARRCGAAGHVRALHGARDQSVREDDRPHRGQIELPRIPCRARTAAAISISSRIAFSTSSPTIAGGQDKVPVRPLYSASMDGGAGTADQGMFYTVRRLPRRRTVEEKRVTARRPTTPAPTCSCPSSSRAASTARARRSSSACARCAPTAI